MVRIAPPAERTHETPTATPAADDIERLGDRIAEIVRFAAPRCPT
jgi:hypothetical protein